VPYVFAPVDEYPVRLQEVLYFVEVLVELAEKLPEHLRGLRRPILLQSADTRVACREARPAQHVIDIQDLFPFAERPEQHRQCTHIHRHAARRHKVGGNSGHLADQHPDILCAPGRFDSQKLLHGQDIGNIVGDR
jgi:hypothetical protein